MAEQHIINRLLRDPEMVILLTGCYEQQHFLDLYNRVSRRLGSSTKGAVVAVDRNRNIIIDGVFATPSSTSDFYYAFDAGKPCLLKLSKQPQGVQILQREADVYAKVYRAGPPGLSSLVPVELIALDDPRPQHASTVIQALKLQVFVRTLEDCPYDSRLAELFFRVGSEVLKAMKALHAVNLVHCDIKPSNIFITSDGVVLLGDYDAVVGLGQPVFRSTQRYLPEPYRTQFSRNMLLATTAIDYGMLLLTLLECVGIPLTPQLQVDVVIDEKAEELRRATQYAGPRSRAIAAIHTAQEHILDLLRSLLRDSR